MWVFSTIRSPSFSDLKINKRQVQQRRGRLNENLRPPDSAKLNLHTFPLQCGAKKLLALNQCAHKPDMMVKGACHATDLGYCAWKKTGSPFFLVLITLRAVFSLFQHKRLQRTQWLWLTAVVVANIVKTVTRHGQMTNERIFKKWSVCEVPSHETSLVSLPLAYFFRASAQINHGWLQRENKAVVSGAVHYRCLDCILLSCMITTTRDCLASGMCCEAIKMRNFVGLSLRRWARDKGKKDWRSSAASPKGIT